jgi:superfamily II DNA or RNA helicase/diadenosine tetraphosphate (Ap4A) HIT family hydrolase/HKD family nuclease
VRLNHPQVVVYRPRMTPPDAPLSSVFLAVPPSEWVASNALAFAIRDGYPVGRGHTLVVPRRLVRTWFDATPEEQAAIFALVDVVKADLDAEYRPDGYNVGFNAGEAAGQTVMHLHVHVIPRYRGDMDDPRGGVRHVIPSQGNYLTRAQPLTTGTPADPFERQIYPLLLRALTVDVVSAFVQASGLRRVRPAFDAALARGATVRVITGDYLAITQVEALESLLDLQASSTLASDDDAPSPSGRFEARVIEVDRLKAPTRSFHPKAWRFTGPGLGVAFVGSSNLSEAALSTAIEWNLRVERDRDTHAWERVGTAFDALWNLARPLDAPWIADYARRSRLTPRSLPPGELQEEVVEPPKTPHEVQVEALAALQDARHDGRRRALVVLATGLGKTWLAAFDYLQLWDELGRRPRLLFLAHRREILRQAAATWRALLHQRATTATVGWFLEESGDLDADLVFASVAKLSRSNHRKRLADQVFDYVVVDEVHHAAADSYRRILAALDPTFLLGLTATPDRSDSADILGLFDDFIAYRAGIERGVAVGRLVPFQYFGIKDDINYANIPWKNRRFDPERLAEEAATEARMRTLWKAWNKHTGTRTLVFCCSIAHARFVKEWLTTKGVRVAAVYAEAGSDDRTLSLERLARHELDAVCAVDVFNEGVDLPTVDRVVMLRPTESGVVFLQQLGRGLRAALDKSALTVIDFVGNHRVFIERLHTLLSLGANTGQATAVGTFLRAAGPIDLPAGCSVDVELEAKRMLELLINDRGADAVEQAYRDLRDEREQRPHAGELARLGYTISTVSKRHGGWFGFVASEKDLSIEERGAFELARAFLRDLETTNMTKSFKMVTLSVLLDDESLVSGAPLDHIATRAWSMIRRSPELLEDVPEDERPSATPDERERRRWLAYWRKNPIEAWTGAKPGKRAWFRLEGDHLRFDLNVPPALAAPLAGLVREIVDLRLWQYRVRQSDGRPQEAFVCRVTWNQGNPILALPKSQRRLVPSGETAVRLPDGAVWSFRFAKETCESARPVGADRNQLPDLMRRWFGPDAGHPDHVAEVRFSATPEGLWVEPLQANVVAFPSVNAFVAYPDLRAAAGVSDEAGEMPGSEAVMLPVGGDPDLFAVRVAGTSMDGGPAPLHDGDWALLRWSKGAPADALNNRVVLVQGAALAGTRFQLKRLVRGGEGWQFRSDNPAGPSFDATEDMRVLARLDRAVPPEALAPSPGTVLTAEELAQRFGVENLPPENGRHGGHLFLFINEKGQLEAPDRVRMTILDRRPGETAYVLATGEAGLRYLGVGRWSEEDGRWHIPEVDFATWRLWGEGRSASRPLPKGCLERAQSVIDAVLALPEAERWVDNGGTRGHVLGRSARGGLRIDGGDGGFNERTVSLIDIAWVAAAAADGGMVDVDRVNRLRYLDGTPEESTRFIDTRWAVGIWRMGVGRVVERWTSGPRRVRDGAVELDATYSVEDHAGKVSVIIEARGGTAGGAAARNTEYRGGLELLLGRLGRANCRIVDAQVDSGPTRELAPEDRRIPMEGYPVTITDADALTKTLMRLAAAIGRAPGARGSGNSTKRLRLFVDGGSGAEVVGWLEG